MPRIAYLLPLAVIVAVGLGFTVFRIRHQPARDSLPSTRNLSEGTCYYVFVRSLEVAPRKPSGKHWDAISGQAPDPYYEVHWRDNRIFASATQRDQLIATWSPLGVDTLKSIREGRLSIDSVIKAATMRAGTEEYFDIRVYDDDPISQDTIATLHFAHSDLHIGDNVFHYDTAAPHAVTQLNLCVIDAEQPLFEKLEQALNPR